MGKQENLQLEAVQRMQDYIEVHLYEEITPGDLARVSYYSPWYSRQLFIQLLNMTPAVYIRKLRLSKSALKLRDESTRILDLAYETGYSSVDGYQRAFLREFGCNPQEYAKKPVPIYLFHPYGVIYRKEKEIKNMTETKNIFLQVMERPARKFLFKRGIKATEYFSYSEEVGCDVWELLLSIKSIVGEPVCVWLPKQLILPGTSEYVQGVEVTLDYDGKVPDGFDLIDLPASKYLMFQGEPFEEEDYTEAIAQVQRAIERYDLSVTGYAPDPENPRIQLAPIGTRGYIELIPIK